MVDYKELCLSVCSLAREVGAFVAEERKRFKADLIERKGKNDFVTYVDKESERRIVERLTDMLPDSGFEAEEQTSTKRGERFNWIIDPVDGTTNYIHGLPPHAISIALKENDEIVVGVVYEIALRECFYAWKDGGAFLNDHPIGVSKVPTVEQALLATGFPYSDYSRIDPYMETLRYFFTHSQGLRRIGSAATDLAYVACGRFEAFYEYALKPWDVAAGAFIVQRAGGKVSTFDGGNDFLYGGELIASNGMVFEEMKSVVGSIMNR